MLKRFRMRQGWHGGAAFAAKGVPRPHFASPSTGAFALVGLILKQVLVRFHQRARHGSSN